jgi:alpha-galactosidase
MTNTPKFVQVETVKKQWINLMKVSDLMWRHDDIEVILKEVSNGYQATLSSNEAVSRVHFSWENLFEPPTLFFGDAFERAYGDLAFDTLHPEKVFHWYFMAKSKNYHSCFGVKIQPNAFCAWTVNGQTIDLWMDIRNGTLPLQLNGRTLEIATIVMYENGEESSFDSMKTFCQIMSDSLNNPVKLPTQPIVGGNDWYYAYGANSKDLILKNARFLAEVGRDIPIEPWMVIDDGWQINHAPDYNGGPWNQGNKKFGEMEEIVQGINDLGVHPGIWIRPLLSREPEWKSYAIRKEQKSPDFFLDISHHKVLEKVAKDIGQIVEWGFELIKHDFTTFDTFGCWGKEMGLNYFSYEMEFYDKTKTTAEIVKQFYQIIRESAKGALIMGCNTISHLSAGVFEIQRTGDDTSGREFARTRKYGVNTLAFRMPQHHSFYLSDADCVGITKNIPWAKNKKWLDLLASSGTPLFISCDPKELTESMKKDIKEAFLIASKTMKSAVPVDWEYQVYPMEWETQHGKRTFTWFDEPREYHEEE